MCFLVVVYNKDMRKILLFFTIAVIYNSVNAQIFVDQNASGLNNGSSWDNAYNSIQNAIDMAITNDDIWVRSGTYLPEKDFNGQFTSNNRLKIFTLKDGVKLYGGFSGTENSINQRDVLANPTILSGEFGVENDNTDNVYSVVLALDLSSNSTLDGFNIQGAYNNRTGSSVTIGGYTIGPDDGGGMLLIASDLQISNCTFSDNYVGDDGAGILINESSNPIITNTVFRNNVSDTISALGGGIFLRDSGANFDNCIFDGNQAFDSGAIHIFNIIAPVSFNNCEFINNTAVEDGGAISVFNNTSPANFPINFNNCSFDSNRTTLAAGFGVIASRGGAVFIANAISNFTNCSFSNNQIVPRFNNTGVSGAAVYFRDVFSKIENCTFSNNGVVNVNDEILGAAGAILFRSQVSSSALEINNSNFIGNYSGQGGALVISGNGFGSGFAAVNNCLFVDNFSSDKGGAIFCSATHTTFESGFTNLTFYNNTAQNLGSGIIIDSFSSSINGNVHLNNTIFDSNTNDDVAFDGVYTSADLIESNNKFQSDPTDVLCENISDLDGDDDVFGTSDDGIRLGEDSTFINAGTNSNLFISDTKTSWVTTDADISGQSRIIDNIVDLGAHEGAGTLSINDDLNKNEFTIYPNPADQILTIRSNTTIGRITIYDLNGRLLQTLYPNSNTMIYLLSVSALSKGIYFLEAQFGGLKSTQKFIKN
jgi:predicted outer membrane repeat protein